MTWLTRWWRALWERNGAPKPNPRALDPAFQRAARIQYELRRRP